MKKCFSIVLTVLMAAIAFTAFSSVNAVSVESNQSVHTNQTADLGIPPLDFGDSNDYDSGGSDWGGSSDLTGAAVPIGVTVLIGTVQTTAVPKAAEKVLDLAER